ncbi:MAG: methyl-accepting chemotaxis protein [Pirellulales bacterium]
MSNRLLFTDNQNDSAHQRVGLRIRFSDWLTRCGLAWKALSCQCSTTLNICSDLLQNPVSPTATQKVIVDKHYLDQLESETAKLQVDNRQLADQVESLEHLQLQLKHIGLTFLDRIDGSLESARKVTEAAALTIGSNVSRLYETAAEDNILASKTLEAIVGQSIDCNESHSQRDEILAEVIMEQEQSTNRFVTSAQQFFDAQSKAATNVRDACVSMRECVAKVDQLVFSSELLSFNIRCEAVRLGNDGSPFAVLAEEMVRFSHAIKSANLDINESLRSLSDLMSVYYDDSQVMKSQIDMFAVDLGQQIRRVQHKTSQLTQTLESTLQHITTSNGSLMKASQDALSELQFQDPLAQDLHRTLHEAHKLRALILSGRVQDTHLSDLDPTVGSGKEPDQEPGLVALF